MSNDEETYIEDFDGSRRYLTPYDLGSNTSTSDSKPDTAVSSPSHYTTSSIECIDAIRASLTPAEFQGYCAGNVMKYKWRWRMKNGVEDLEKAAVYMKWMIESVKENKE